MPLVSGEVENPTDSVVAVPRLLVSVRDLSEADSAIVGGCDIVDIKEPLNGALGMASVTTLHQVAARCAEVRTPSSAALGEVVDWEIRDAEQLKLPDDLSFAKIGLARLANRSDWIDDWVRLRAAFELGRKSPMSWIAVAYADSELAESPPTSQVLTAAIETRCKGLLIDTTTKRAKGSILDYVTVDELADISLIAQENGLLFAVAGQIGVKDLPAMKRVAPNIIAVRSAACSGFNRQASVDQKAVASLKQAILKST